MLESYIMKDALEDDYATLIEEVSNKCEVCKRYKKTPPRPAVSLPLARQFNDVVAMDLKQFSKSKVIRRKTPKVIVESIPTEWIAVRFGPPKKFLVDNGGELSNAEYRELTEQLNIEVCTTAAYSPWSNGICERNHYVVDICVQKMMEEDPQMNLEVTLTWAVNAKNCLQNQSGFSPIQLVLGTNPNLPSVLNNCPPALGKVSEAVAKHLNALHAARRAYTRSEASEWIHRALHHNFRVPEFLFQPGECVYFKHNDSDRWRGLGKVIGQDGKIVFIRHGSQLVRVASRKLIKSNHDTTSPDDMRQQKQR
ncbi:uncharacterized protein [Diadema setosum]|uniref:uncharacterized protein n=1 Tax=Diadema setosum TaxID=31175 RepID=UPI003B3BB61D